MSARDGLLIEINQLPESVLVETLHFMRFAARKQEKADSGLPKCPGIPRCLYHYTQLP